MRIFKNRIFIGALSLILAVVIGFVAVPVYTNLATVTITVVTAAKDISCGVQITEDMLTETEISKIGLPKGVAVNKDDVIGQYALDDIYAGYYITNRTVAEKLVTPDAKIRAMKDKECVVPVPIGGNVNALTKFLPNDIVTFYSVDKETGQAYVIDELTYVSVMACSTSDGVYITQNNQKATDGSELVPANINFILNNDQSIKLLSTMNESTIYILLTYRGTNQLVIDQYLKEQDKLLNGNQSKTQTTTAALTTQNRN